MRELQNSPQDSHLTIKKNDFILIFSDNLSISDIKAAGLIFVAVYLLIYVLLLVWAHFKDQEKQTYSTKVNSDLSTSQITMPRRPNFRAMNIDITSDTLDFTNQSVRMNFEDQKDMSTILQNAGSDGFSVISPMHKPDSMNVSPLHQGGKKTKFNLLRTPPRSFQRIDLDATSPTALPTAQEEIMTTNNEPAISKESGTTKDEALTRKEMSNIIEDLTKDEDFLNKNAAKPKRQAKAKKEGKGVKITKNRQTVKSKFLKLLDQRHAIWSTIQRMSRIFPRYKRISLLYFLFSCNLFITTICFINSSIFELFLWQLLKVSAFTWVLFVTLSWLSSVSKEGLKYAKTMDEFQSILANLEKEAKYKDIFVHIIIGLFLICAFSQYALFITVKWNYALYWIGCSILVFFIQMVLFDALWEFVIAYLYVKAYDSKEMKKLYRRLNSIRFWRV